MIKGRWILHECVTLVKHFELIVPLRCGLDLTCVNTHLGFDQRQLWVIIEKKIGLWAKNTPYCRLSSGHWRCRYREYTTQRRRLGSGSHHVHLAPSFVYASPGLVIIGRYVLDSRNGRSASGLGGHHNVSKDTEHNKKNQENGDNKNDNPEVLPVML